VGDLGCGNVEVLRFLVKLRFDDHRAGCGVAAALLKLLNVAVEISGEHVDLVLQ
jgi:hypothetical protein